MTVTLMGGDMQAQGIAQVLVNILDLGANLQAATDMARFRHAQVPNRLELESEPLCSGRQGSCRHGPQCGPRLRRAGRRLPIDPVHAAAPKVGTNAQPLHGYYRAGSDHRKDGHAVGW